MIFFCISFYFHQNHRSLLCVQFNLTGFQEYFFIIFVTSLLFHVFFIHNKDIDWKRKQHKKMSLYSFTIDSIDIFFCINKIQVMAIWNTIQQQTIKSEKIKFYFPILIKVLHKKKKH